MKRTLQTLALSVLILFSMCGAAHAATADTYDTYTQMFSRSAGQYWTGASAAGQWAWAPQSSTESWVYWGNPATWPPVYHERFIHSGDWVMLDGWWDNGTYYTLRTTTEWQANADCFTGKTMLPLGAQHYTHWTIPATSYCLFAAGTVKEQSTGKTIHFQHQQIWSVASGGNAYFGSVPELKQTEQWSDDNGTDMSVKLQRDQYIAKGYGEAFAIRQTIPSVWNTDLRYAWSY